MFRPRSTTVAVALLLSVLLTAGAPGSIAGKKGGRESITASDLKSWLTYFSSDQFEGRATFTEGLGLAAGYIAEQLRAWGVKPAGDNGTYFQTVSVLGIKSENRSSVTVEAHGEKRSFKVGEGISLPAFVGAKRVVSSREVEFLGYGLSAPSANHNDYAGRDVKGKIAVWIGNGPRELPNQARRLLFGRARFATEQMGAIATIGPPSLMGPPGAQPPSGQAGAPGQGAGQAAGPAQAGGQRPAAQQQQAPQGMGFGGPAAERPDFTTVQRLDGSVAPAVAAREEFFQFLFEGQEYSYADLKAKADNRETLPRFQLKNVSITVNIDADYRIVRTQRTRNVVGVVEGKDAKLKGTYVAFGAHYDHVGFAEGELVQTSAGPRRAEAKGRVKDGALDDRFWNGADDDGSGSISLLALARAFAQGPKPRRSLVFVWHTGEERGLWGSRYFADYPTVPMDNIVAELNMDMVGRDRDDKKEESNSVYVIGSDRISTELHNLLIDANGGLKQPLKLDFEYNDPADPESLYTRSDHYSYAVKGVPVVFLTTGLHPDYHANTDSAEKINYEKMARITQMLYDLGMRTGNLHHAPVRDNRGPRVGKGSAGKLAVQ
jgi:hypothetical protein